MYIDEAFNDDFVFKMMIRLIVIALSILYTAVSCTKDDYMAIIPTNVDTSVTQVVTDTTASRSFLALGDSYTIGQSVAEADRFPVQTAKFLNNQGIKFSAPEIIAQTGGTTDNLLSRLASAAPLKQQYDIVTLLTGVYNQYQHRTQQEYGDQL